MSSVTPTRGGSSTPQSHLLRSSPRSPGGAELTAPGAYGAALLAPPHPPHDPALGAFWGHWLPAWKSKCTERAIRPLRAKQVEEGLLRLRLEAARGVSVFLLRTAETGLWF